MDTRQLGRSDLNITPIGFGAWAIGGRGWGGQNDEDSIQAIHRALDLGVNWIDTAAVYGLGHSEEVVARALQDVSSRPYVFTKCGLVWDDEGKVTNNLDPESVRRECEASLRRLRMDAIDLYQIHWPVPDDCIVDAWRTLVDLQREGKVRNIGVSNFSVEQLRRIGAIQQPTSDQPPYSLARPDTERNVLPYCQQHGIGVIVYSPMQSGLLTGKLTRERIQNLPEDDWRRGADEFQEPQLTKNLRLADLLKQIGQRHGVSAGRVAVAWTLANPAVTGAIVGFRNPGQVDDILGAGSFELSPEELEEINDLRARLGQQIHPGTPGAFEQVGA